MADDAVNVLNVGTKKVDCSQVTVGVDQVDRQRIVVADDSDPGALAAVKNAQPTATDYGMVVRLPTGQVVQVQPATPTGAMVVQVPVSFSASGDNVLVAGVAAQTIRVMRMMLSIAQATGIQFEDTGVLQFSGRMAFGQYGTMLLGYEGEPWYITGVGQGFVINQTNPVQISGTVWYTQS